MTRLLSLRWRVRVRRKFVVVGLWFVVVVVQRRGAGGESRSAARPTLVRRGALAATPPRPRIVRKGERPMRRWCVLAQSLLIYPPLRVPPFPWRHIPAIDGHRKPRVRAKSARVCGSDSCLRSRAVLGSSPRPSCSATRKATLARTVEVASSAKRTRSDVAYGRIPPGAEPFMAGTRSDETTRISWKRQARACCFDPQSACPGSAVHRSRGRIGPDAAAENGSAGQQRLLTNGAAVLSSGAARVSLRCCVT